MIQPIPTRPSRLAAILRQRCPCCLRGRVFAGRIRMNGRCPECGEPFGREPGYYLGAMYFSYALAVPVFSFFLFLAWLWRPQWSLFQLAIPAQLVFLMFVPLLFRLSRVLWIHFDRWIDPPSQ